MHNNQPSIVQTWIHMLNGGIPLEHLRHLVNRHITGLSNLPDDTEGKFKELELCQKFKNQFFVEEDKNVK